MNFYVFVLCTLLASCYSKPNNVGIIGGKVARVGEFPWQAAVYVDTADGKFFCGGSLINNQWILTAGHCVYNARLFTIHLGSITLQAGDPNRVVLSTSTSVVFPDFDPLTLEHDIGLIKLHMKVELSDYVQPIELADIGAISEGSAVIVSGWGQTTDATAGLSNNLQYTNVVIISNNECKQTYGDQIKNTMICTAGNFNEGICTGDTGGPLIRAKGADNYVQIAVARFFSQSGCEQLHPSGYIRTDLYKAWIQNVTETM